MNSEPAEPKPKRTRRTRAQMAGEKTAVDMQAEIANISGQLAMLLNSAFYAVSLSAGEHWRLQQDEAFTMSTTLTVAIKSSFPEEWIKAYEDVLLRYAPWVAVAATFGSTINKRIEYGKILAAQKQADENHQGIN